MSLSGERAALASLLTAVDDLTGYAHRPNAITPGDAWPLIDFLERQSSPDFEVTWLIIVVLPRDEQTAMEWFDDKHEEIADALSDFGYVDRIEPWPLQTEAGVMDCMILTLRKEA